MRTLLVRMTNTLGTTSQHMTQAEVNRYITAWSDSLGVLSTVGQSRNLGDQYPRVRIEVSEVPEVQSTYEVHEGIPSWHQQKAGHISAGVTTGFATRKDAEDFAERLKSQHPGMQVFIREVQS